jgi:thiamine kinase-like enzyme
LDLHLSNIILKDNEEIFLIDWVNGGISDPFFDLATFSYFSELNEVHNEIFLTSYFQRVPTEIEKARFNVILPVRAMVIAASFFSSVSNNTNSTEAYIEKSIDLIESETFKRSLKQLQNIALRKI